MAKAAKKLLYGVGINDADYAITKNSVVDGKQKQIWICPIYSTWKSMLRRCYCEKFHSQQASYIDCFVSPEWYYFMTFRAWMVRQDWEGKHLDKDILIVGNKEYGPRTCAFISRKLNNFVSQLSNKEELCPVGVYVEKRSARFVASCCNIENGHQEYLGAFETAEEAQKSWLAFKLSQAHILAAEQTDPRVAAALIDRYENYHIYFPQAR